MPIAYQIDRTEGVVFSRAHGRVTDRELLDHQDQLAADPDFEPSMNHLFDFLEVEETDLSSEGIRALAGQNPFGTESRRALVADRANPLLFGMLRMYQAWCQEHPDDMRVQYNHREEALLWVLQGSDPE